MKRKNPEFRKVVMSISAIGILYFAVVNVIGDTIGIFGEAPLYDPAQDPGLAERPPAEMLDHVRNSDLVTAVLFPDGTRRRAVPPQAAFPDPAPFGNFDFMDAGTDEYFVATNPGSNLLASLNPRSTDPQHFTPFTSSPNYFGGNQGTNQFASLSPQSRAPRHFTPASNPNNSDGNRGNSALPGTDQEPPAISGQPTPDTTAGGGKSLPPEKSGPSDDFIPIQIAASHIPNNSFDGNRDDKLYDDDAPRGVSENNLQPRTPSPVPEPGTLLLMLLGMGSLRHYRKRPGL